MFQDTLKAIQESTRAVERTVDKSAGEMKAVQADNQRQEKLLTGHGKAIGSLNMEFGRLKEQHARIATRTRNIWEERKKMDKKLDDQDENLRKLSNEQQEMAGDLRAIRRHIMRPGRARTIWSWIKSNPKLVAWTIIAAALAVLAVTVGPEFVRELLSGIQ